MGIENQRALAERQIEEQRAQSAALQTYLSDMNVLLLDEHLRTAGPDSSVRTIANVQTFYTLERLDPARKETVLRLLNDLQLIDVNAPLIDLTHADLQGIDLSSSDFSGTDLSRANLSDAYLRDTNLSDAALRGADLQYADLTGAQFSHTDLRRANLSGARVKVKQLREADTLKGAIMPNGQRYEEWLKGKDSRMQDGENSGRS